MWHLLRFFLFLVYDVYVKANLTLIQVWLFSPSALLVQWTVLS